jgi:hypothetical protein
MTLSLHTKVHQAAPEVGVVFEIAKLLICPRLSVGVIERSQPQNSISVR